MGLAKRQEIATRSSRPPLLSAVVFAAVGAFTVAVVVAGCGPQGHYFRGDAGNGSGGVSLTDGPTRSGGAGGGGGTGLTGASGGGPGTGGVIGTGGADTGGAGTGGSATGGAATGGRGTGGAATGGVGTGGSATGGMGTGGAATGGMGTGGAATGGAGPSILSIDFVGGKTATGGAGGAVLVPSTPMAPTEIAGYRPAANWNSARGPMGTLPALKLMDGTATAATVTWNSPLTGANPGIWQNRYTDAPGDVRMMNGYIDPTATTSPATVVVSGLPASFGAAGYDVYVYATGDINDTLTRMYNYRIGTTTVSVSQTGMSPSIFPGYVVAPAAGANTVIFRNVTGTGFTLTATPGTGTPRAPVNGLQIVSPRGM